MRRSEHDNVVAGDFIGTDVSGTLALGNAGHGVNVANDNGDSATGGTDAGAGNTIAHNAQDGVHASTSIGNAIRGNSIFADGRLGIELLSGGNRNQAFPVLTSADFTDGTLTIGGTLTSTPDTAFALEFFANIVCNPSGFGEGGTIPRQRSSRRRRRRQRRVHGGPDA